MKRKAGSDSGFSEPNDYRRRRRTLAWSSGGGAALLALLVLAAPLAAGASTSSVLKAPYSGAPDAGVEWEAQGCGYKTSTPVVPAFDLTSGVAKETVVTSAKSCGSTESGIEAAVAAGLNSSATFTTTTGSHKIAVAWTLKFTVTLTASPAPSQSAVAESAVFAEATLYDSTTGISYSIGVFDQQNYSFNGTFSHTFTVKVTLSASLALLSGQTYQVETLAEAFAISSASPGASSASATVNVGSAGDSAKLTSITIP